MQDCRTGAIGMQPKPRVISFAKSSLSTAFSLVQAILKEVRCMADNIKEGDSVEEINSDWKFAAMVSTGTLGTYQGE